jgi:choline dehydrogenase-like flavoprotein
VLINAGELAPGSALETDVCIVGSGPSGLTLARELRGQSFRVMVVEGGGFASRRKLKQLNEGTTVGDNYPNPRWGRSRQFGGTANRWLVQIGANQQGARYAPLDPIDFEQREETPYSGWPLRRADLDPFYERAHVHCQLGPFRYDTEPWVRPGSTPLNFPSGNLTTSMFQFGSKDVWTQHYADVVHRSGNLTTLINATVIEVETDPGGENVTGVRMINEAREEFHVRAKIVILAVGCIETSRLLLLSRGSHSRGIGNQNDLVGRFFMDHPQAFLSVIKPYDRRVFDTSGIYDLQPQGKYAVMAKLVFSEEAMRRERLQNACFALFPRRDHFMSEAFQSFFTVTLDVMHASRPRNLGLHTKNMITGLPHLTQIGMWWLQGTAHYPYISRGGWSTVKNRSLLFSMFELFSLIEQVPDPDNRIVLGERRDFFGVPQVQIHWRFTNRDRENVARMRQVFSQEVRKSGLGTTEFHPEPFTSPSSVHPIGGARMSDDPSRGVVDANLKVHGVNNLYLASSAVFPTGGYANPTLTVVALACRLADRVKREMAQPPVVLEAMFS